MLYTLRNQPLHTEVYEEYSKIMTAIFEHEGFTTMRHSFTILFTVPKLNTLWYSSTARARLTYTKLLYDPTKDYVFLVLTLLITYLTLHHKWQRFFSKNSQDAVHKFLSIHLSTQTSHSIRIFYKHWLYLRLFIQLSNLSGKNEKEPSANISSKSKKSINRKK